MYRIIGAEQVQVNTIRINSNTETQERSESPKSEELSPLGDKQGSSKEKGKYKASMEPITIKEIPIEKASSPYEVIQIKAKGKLMSAVIIYDTGSEVSLCNQETKPIVTSAKKERKKIMISTINSVQNGLMQVCKLKLKNDQNIEAIMLPNMKLQLQPQNIPNHWLDLEGEWADQDTYGVTAQVLLGANQATRFPHAIKDSTGALL